jgi:hypothetical protein
MRDRHLNDREMDAVLRTWLQDATGDPPDRSRVVANVVGRLGRTRRRRRRWWPFSASRRGAPTDDTQPTDDQPDLIPARSGDATAITRRTQSMLSPTKAIAAGAIVFAIGGVLLGAQSLDRKGESAPGVATEVPAETGVNVTGGWALRDAAGSHDFEESVQVEGGARERGELTVGQLEMSDERLSGELTWTREADRFFDLTEALDSADVTLVDFADVTWGTVSIANDGGAWEGRQVGTSDAIVTGPISSGFDARICTRSPDGVDCTRNAPAIVPP